MIPSLSRYDDWRHAVAHFRAVAATLVFYGLAWAILVAAPPASAGPPSIVTPVPLRDLDTLIAQTERGVLVAMASWCGPCKAELPHLVKLHKHYHGQGLALYGVSVDFAGAQAMQPMVNRFGVEFPVYWVGEAGVERYGLNPIPMLVFIQNGRVVDRLQGAHSEEELRTIFDNFLTPREP
ncbi:TlpA family protein disulfide reductase [Desulfovibrio sulfodismutans]|uniref:TlpA family protein disulfide reductase n=2 Tax=Desulfolutivibrio sulfodismutans TaxID=63561 RepID=A0A7K3NGM5_9BACT|nr:TlpA family protein disulfide reductase [Desulfolutivibrio sulfodismutans]